MEKLSKNPFKSLSISAKKFCALAVTVKFLIIIISIPVNEGGRRLKDIDEDRDESAGPQKTPFHQLQDNFKIIRVRHTWRKALEFCGRCIGTFATFDSPEQATRIREEIYNLSVVSPEYVAGKARNEWGLERRYWLGMSDDRFKNGSNATEGKWKWYKKFENDPGTPVSNWKKFKWTVSQPDHLTPGFKTEHCVGFWNPVFTRDEYKQLGKLDGSKQVHTFNDMACRSQYYFICKDGTPTDPSDLLCLAAESPPPSDSRDDDEAPKRKRHVAKETTTVQKPAEDSSKKHKHKKYKTSKKPTIVPKNQLRKKRSVRFVPRLKGL